MDLPKNKFKQALAEGRQQLGLWSVLTSSYSAEIIAGAGYDWVLIDTEHSPSGVEGVLPQLQAMAPYDVSPVVRAAWNDTVLIKRYLDIGVQTLLLPFVQSAQEARAAVAAVRYPPGGVRGISTFTRANRFGRVKDYVTRAGEEICLLVQVETKAAIDVVEEIAAVDGIDGIFVGPSDLAASLGYLGSPAHEDVMAVIENTLRRIAACGKPPGFLTADFTIARRAVAAGSRFTAIGVDGVILARGAENLLAQFKSG
ncbi:MAG: aldolase/citrate lyase family protein [Rhodospirillaceae bacterium]